MAEFKMININKVELTGYCTRDPELRYVGAENTPVCKIGVAVKDYKKGEKAAIFIDVAVWGATAEHAAKMKKGYPLYVDGKLTQDEWQDKTTGQTRRSIGVKAFRTSCFIWDNENGVGRIVGDAGNEREEMEPFMESGADLPF